MCRCLLVVSVALIVCCSPPLLAAESIALFVERGPGDDEITLSWTGGAPPYRVYRSVDPSLVVDDSNQLGETSEKSWVDAPPDAPLHAYVVRSDACAEVGDLVIAELMIDPDALSDSRGEWIEVFNPTASDVDLVGWTLRDASSTHLIDDDAPVIVPAGGYAVLALDAGELTACGITADYDYASVTLNNSGDTVALESCGVVVDEVVYGSGFSERGSAMGVDPGALDAAANDDLASWCPATSVMTCGDRGTPALDNEPCP
jgi:hypothetical protein